MAKSILISIKPRYVADILNHKKTIEVRKVMPKCELPIQVYIYCTKDNHQLVKPKDYEKYLLFTKGAVNYSHEQTLNGKVVAKFTLKCVVPCKLILERIYDKIFIPQYQLTHKELEKYVGNKDFYEWHISDLEIFDRPLPLQPYFDLDRAPQSYQFIEEPKENK